MSTTKLPDSPAMSATRAWLHLLATIPNGEMIGSRNGQCVEYLGVQSVIDMRRPLVLIPERNLSMQFAAAEAMWILEGSSLLEPLIKHAPSYERYSDDGYMLDGAYGPKVISQMRYVVETLMGSRNSRQAVMGIWRENPRDSRDVPCTLSMQFLVRQNKLHMIVTMRSSDVWLGFPYDVFSFTMIASVVALELRRNLPIELGNLYLNAGSQHIYETNFEKVKAIQKLYLNDHKEVRELSDHTITQFNTPRDLYADLIAVRNAHFGHNDRLIGRHGFFKEMCEASK